MRLIDADAIKYNYFMMPETTDSSKIAVSKDKIDHMPTIDAEPIVRCKDCKYSDHGGWCFMHYTGCIPNDYCSWGEMKNEAD